MSPFLNRRTLFHRFIDSLMPENCRENLEKAFVQNHNACVDFVCYLRSHEHKVVAALKHDRRAKERKHD